MQSRGAYAERPSTKGYATVRARLSLSGYVPDVDSRYRRPECILADTARAENVLVNAGTPFYLGRDGRFQRWRERKLEDAVLAGAQPPVEIATPPTLSDSVREAIRARCRRHNLAIYRFVEPAQCPDRGALGAFGTALGLTRFDPGADGERISEIRVRSGDGQEEYIPYTTRPINWHTDGYYNPPARQVRGFILHCVRAAESGGENVLFDPELLYLMLRDEDPDYVRALLHPRALTIPANPARGRPARTGPVFSVDPADGSLHTRYTARTRSVEWLADDLTREAVAFLRTRLRPDSRYALRLRLESGTGVVCNNVLHSRASFEDGVRGHRLLWRARYLERVPAGSGERGEVR